VNRSVDEPSDNDPSVDWSGDSYAVGASGEEADRSLLLGSTVGMAAMRSSAVCYRRPARRRRSTRASRHSGRPEANSQCRVAAVIDPQSVVAVHRSAPWASTLSLCPTVVPQMTVVSRGKRRSSTDDRWNVFFANKQSDEDSFEAVIAARAYRDPPTSTSDWEPVVGRAGVRQVPGRTQHEVWLPVRSRMRRIRELWQMAAPTMA